MLSDRELISVTGLGVVGLTLALAFARKRGVVAYDCNEEHVERLRRGDETELRQCDLGEADIEFTSNPADLARASFHIIVTPTPVDSAHMPDLTLLRRAMHSVGKILGRGDTVVVESTVYPGCTEEVCLPILESESGLKAGEDFLLGYCPERLNPGDKEHTITNTTKIISGHTPEALERIAETYALLLGDNIYRAPSIKTAEAAKMVENTQRDVNIALMNELSVVFNRLGLETSEVIKAASTKWNFMPFYPGLVGGHCISVDPYYLDYVARQVGCETQIISRARQVNDSMGRYVASQTVEQLTAQGIDVTKARVLLMGLSYKENVADVRNTLSVELLSELKSLGVGQVDVVDPVASKRDSLSLYGIEPKDECDGQYDAIVVAVRHDCFASLGKEFFDGHLNKKGIIIDLHGLYRESVRGYKQWRL